MLSPSDFWFTTNEKLLYFIHNTWTIWSYLLTSILCCLYFSISCFFKSSPTYLLLFSPSLHYFFLLKFHCQFHIWIILVIWNYHKLVVKCLYIFNISINISLTVRISHSLLLLLHLLYPCNLSLNSSLTRFMIVKIHQII
jgi:hypothetical protein